MKKTYIKINDVRRIRLNSSNRDELKWFEAKPEIKTFFGIITKQYAEIAGWAYKEDYSRHTEERLNEDNRYMFIEEENIWRERTSVYIDYKKHRSEEFYFDTLKEAQNWVNSLLDKHQDTFEVVYS